MVADRARVAEKYDLQPGRRAEASHYHVHARLKDGREALLVDPGAHDNLSGDEWFTRVQSIAGRQGLETRFTDLRHSMSVGGVGKGSQWCDTSGHAPIALGDGSHGVYNAPIIQNSPMPALLGNKTLTRMGAILNLGDGKFVIPAISSGSAPVEIVVPQGSRVLQMELSDSGHWMLPCTEYTEVDRSRRTDAFISTRRNDPPPRPLSPTTQLMHNVLSPRSLSTVVSLMSDAAEEGQA